MRYALLIIIFAGLIAGCTEVQTLNLTPEYRNISYVPEKDISSAVERDVTEIVELEDGDDVPMTVEEETMAYVDPENLIKKLCPEQVLLGLRQCEALDNGDLNITIKNSGFRNITMVFYLYYENELMGQIYEESVFYEKDEKTYTIDFDTLEDSYGEITKIEATPVLLQGLEAWSCNNKKLPVIIKSGCR
ncbi:hypothetical protein GF345_01815 [Candidatus Woesearchaeota archaeon]|nr:hypothetical protein [Candidatus Woesearchaeota archaeon]